MLFTFFQSKARKLAEAVFKLKTLHDKIIMKRSVYNYVL